MKILHFDRIFKYINIEVVCFIITLTSIVLFSLSSLFPSSFLAISVISLDLCFISTFINAAYNLKKRINIFYILFLGSFFVFLLGGINVCFFENQSLQDIYYNMANYSDDSLKYAILSILISLTFLNIGFSTFSFFYLKKALSKIYLKFQSQIFKRTQNKFALLFHRLSTFDHNPKKIYYIRLSSMLSFYFTSIFSLVVVLEKVLFVLQNSYVELYSVFFTALPLLVHKLAQTNTLSFYVLLCTFPSKKATFPALILYALINSLSLLGGERMGACVAILMVFANIIFRHFWDKQHGQTGWLKRWHIIILCFLLPILLAGLNALNSIRNDISLTNRSFWDELKGFLVNIGGSFNVIAIAKDKENLLPPTNINYTFGPIIEFFQSGTIAQFLGGRSPYTGIDAALYGNNLGATLSYLHLGADSYLAGNGIGSSYIAELFIDYGLIGVLIYNYFLGLLFKKLSFFSTKNVFFNALICYCIRYILIAPRSFAMDWFPNLISLFNLLTLFALYAFSFFLFFIHKHWRR